MPKQVIVEIIESEKGWGSKVDDIVKFETIEEARVYVNKYNSEFKKHISSHYPEIKEGVTPDWYMFAQIRNA